MSSPSAPSFVRRRGPALGLALIAAGSIGVALAQSRPAAPSAAVAAVHGLDPADMNLSARACQDYYQYADGGWLKKNPIPPEFPSWGTFTALAERNREAMRKILEKLAAEKSAPGSEEQKIGDFYASCMDEAAVEAQGAKPIASELERIDKIRNVSDLRSEIARLQKSGVGAVFGFGSQQDRKNSNEVIAGAFQGGIGLPDRDYYTNRGPAADSLRTAYVEHIARLLGLAGETRASARADAARVRSRSRPSWRSRRSPGSSCATPPPPTTPCPSASCAALPRRSIGPRTSASSAWPIPSSASTSPRPHSSPA